MSLIDPDSSVARRFQRDKIAQELFLRVMVADSTHPERSASDLAGWAYVCANAFMDVKEQQPPVLSESDNQRPSQDKDQN